MKTVHSLFHGPISAIISISISVIALAAASSFASPGFQGPIGLQLYSLRDQFKQDVPHTLDEMRDWGVKYAEAYADLLPATKMSPEQLKAQLDARGIKLVSSHFSYEQFRDNIKGVVSDSTAMGLKYAGCAWI